MFKAFVPGFPFPWIAHLFFIEKCAVLLTNATDTVAATINQSRQNNIPIMIQEVTSIIDQLLLSINTQHTTHNTFLTLMWTSISISSPLFLTHRIGSSASCTSSSHL